MFNYLNMEKRFTNGFGSWLQTFYEVVAGFYSNTKSEVLNQIENTGSRADMWQFAEVLTDEFEDIHKGRKWNLDGEFFDEIDNFLKEKLCV